MYFLYKCIQLKKPPNLGCIGKKYIFKLFGANLKVTGINKCQFTNNGPVHHSTLKNASDKYCNITPGGGTKVVSKRNVHSLRGYNSRHYSYCDRTRQERAKKILSLCYAKGPSWLVQGWRKCSFPHSRHRELLEDTWCSALCSILLLRDHRGEWQKWKFDQIWHKQNSPEWFHKMLGQIVTWHKLSLFQCFLIREIRVLYSR